VLHQLKLSIPFHGIGIFIFKFLNNEFQKYITSSKIPLIGDSAPWHCSVTDFFGDRETQSTAGGSLTDDERNNAETVVAEAGTIRQPRLSETKLPNAESTSLARISDINHAPRELLGPLMGPPRITGQLDSMQEEISGVKRAVGSLEERVTRMMQVVERIEVCIMKISCGLLQYWRLSLHF